MTGESCSPVIFKKYIIQGFRGWGWIRGGNEVTVLPKIMLLTRTGFYTAAILGAGVLVSCKQSEPASEAGQSMHVEAEAPDAPVKSISVAGPSSLGATTNDVLLIQTSHGMAALLQFTRFYRGEPEEDGRWGAADYRWRGRTEKLGKINAGKGDVREDYKVVTQPDGKQTVTPRLGHHVKVNAGSIELTWSESDTTSSWIYYDTNKASIKVLPADAFNGEL